MRATRRDGRLRAGIARLAGLGAVIALAACGSDDDDPIAPPGPDTTAPAAITDLRSSRILPTSIRLNWTAPGDDGEIGQAAEYDVRMSLEAITAENWRDATRIPDVPAPLPALLNERLTVTGLLPNTTYHFVVSTADESDNWSGISNIHSVRTAETTDVTPPARIEDLALVTVTNTSATFGWTATGDDGDVGTAFAYDLRFSRAPITEENFFEIVDEGIPDVSPVPQPAGTSEQWEVPGLEPATTYYFAMKVMDEERNYSALSDNVEVTTAP